MYRNGGAADLSLPDMMQIPTPDLSIMLLPEGDVACEVADLTEELNIVSPFDTWYAKKCFHTFRRIWYQ